MVFCFKICSNLLWKKYLRILSLEFLKVFLSKWYVLLSSKQTVWKNRTGQKIKKKMWKTQVEMISKGICPFFLGLDFVKVRNFINKQFGIRSHSLQSIRESKSTWTVKGQNNLKQNTLFTCYWRFLQIKCVLTLKQLKYQWKKNKMW